MTITPTITIGMIVSANEPFVGTVVSIKGKTATVDFGCLGIKKKRLTTLKPYVRKEAYWSEQELHEPIYKHGDTVYAILSGDGNGCRKVWDDVIKECVSPSELSQI